MKCVMDSEVWASATEPPLCIAAMRRTGSSRDVGVVVLRFDPLLARGSVVELMLSHKISTNSALTWNLWNNSKSVENLRKL
jgi:phage terminase large subunit-like protein